ncbi:aspartate kinase [Anoxybacillus flavithermus]|uniref:Aspartokinase n=1 Tax=Anoxybacillus flavithermus TaxID=33934 RepID=A0A2G5RNQ4_9BACL|nr:MULTISPECIES: aspartate kinase [Anoxybacillus]KFZ41697.1 aspartate kinase [Anoxybacillus sp. KU2-6(11)]PIC04330.1 aspartate kinase [Anoxybacillus flavithermus]
MKVAKFGGSSVANAQQFQKVANIVTSDEARKFVVVSAPGKRFKNDTKMTDLLITLAKKVIEDDLYEGVLAQVVARYDEIVTDLHLSRDILDVISASLQQIIDTYDDQPERLLDALKASGEDNNAKLMAHYLRQLGYEAHYVSPKDAGIFVTDEPGNAQILPESYEQLAKLKERSGILVIPGFFGYSRSGHIVTFPRGGSDITGSIVAAGVDAELYENFTDVDSIYCVNPSIVEHPCQLKELTYREMRELSYAGFSVFHDEALEPVYRRGIPVCVKNTNNPEAKGTMIVATRDHRERPVAGIASDTGFCSINVSKYLMNREIGFGRRLLQILEDEGISYEHTPSGIDNMSVILREEQLAGDVERRVLDRIVKELRVDEVSIERDLALIMVVGEGMERSVGIAAKATAAFARANVNIEMINQGSSEVSMMFGVKADAVEKAVRALYEVYF